MTCPLCSHLQGVRLPTMLFVRLPVMPIRFLRAVAVSIALCVVPAVRASSQSTPTPSSPRARSGRDFPSERFELISRAASYLAAYDRVAWVTTDSLVALVRQDTTLGRDLGAEWFAYEQDSTWHAVYGRYDRAADRYVQVAHFAAAPQAPFRRQLAAADSVLARRYGRALALTMARLPAVAREARARFNAYVRPTQGGGLELWYLPAWQPNGWLIHGMEFYYRVDSSGHHVVDSSAVVTTLRGSPPDTTKVLDIFNDQRELPTVGQAFFALYYGRYFKAVYIRSRDFVSTFLNTNGTQAWIHALRQAPDTAKGPSQTRH
jgi:hypothetical protein